MRLALAALVLLLACALPFKAHAASHGWSCWSKAAARYHVDVGLLYAVARVETGARSGIVSRNSDGSYDIGVMQINSWWLPKLATVGITAKMLRDQPCLNVMIGAWILAQGVRKYGLNWRGVGAYNATTDWKRAVYAHKVAKELRHIRAVREAHIASRDSELASAGGGS